MTYADRLNHLTPFKVIDFLEAAIELEQQGRDIVRMETGEPKFPTAAPIAEAAKRAIDQDHTRYTPACGIPELRQAISQRYADQYDLVIDPQRIIVTTGSSAALGMLCELLLNPGDGLLLSDPGYPCNGNFVRRAGAEAQLVPVTAEHHLKLTAELVASHWRANSRGVLVASPGNPSGEVLSHQQMEKLWAVIETNRGILLSDEIYHGLTYGDEPAASALAVTDSAFVINSFSKYFGMTGWRLGWMVVPYDAVESINLMAQNYYISNPSIAQHAALAALQPETLAILEERKDIFRERRDFLAGALMDLGFGLAHIPEGAFYLYANIEKFSDDSEAFCWRLLREYGVACTPGTDFGNNMRNSYIRFSYTESLERLALGVERIAKMVT